MIQDDVAATVAAQMMGLVTTLEGMGLRRASILKGMEIAVEQLRAKGSTGEAQGPAND